MTKFATYLHPHIGYTSKPLNSISFSGYSVPYFSKLRQGLEEALADYPSLPVKKAENEMYLSVHTAEYLEKLKLMAADKPVAEPPRLSLECSGYSNSRYVLVLLQFTLRNEEITVNHHRPGPGSKGKGFIFQSNKG